MGTVHDNFVGIPKIDNFESESKMALRFRFIASTETEKVPDNDTLFNVSSGDKRGEVPLTKVQRAEVDDYLTHFDLNEVAIRVIDNTNLNTGYAHGELFSILNIGSDVVPGNIGVGTLTANSRIGIKGTLAHEMVGHREAALAGKTQDILSMEEAQASIRSARLAPDLDSTERFRLLRDGITRLYLDGIKIRAVKNQLFIQQR